MAGFPKVDKINIRLYFQYCSCSRNSGEIIDQVVKDGQQKISTNYDGYSNTNKVRLDYKKAIHCIRGSDVKMYDSSNYTNTSDAIRDAIHNINTKQSSNRGITVLCNSYYVTSDIIKTVTRFSQQRPLYYGLDDDARRAGVTCATEEEMKMWLSDRGNTNLVADINIAAGWEDGTVIVVDDGRSVDNMCLRTVSNLHIIKYGDIQNKMQRP